MIGVTSNRLPEAKRSATPHKSPLPYLNALSKRARTKATWCSTPSLAALTACVSAETLHRQWVGIDLSPLAAKLVKSRLKDEFKLFYELNHRTDVLRRTDLGKLPRYRTHKHQLFGKQEGRCGGCRVVFPFRNFTIDHVVPQSQGGSDHFDNLQLLCGRATLSRATGPTQLYSPRSGNVVSCREGGTMKQKKPKAKHGRGRPRIYVMPDPIPDTPENIARIFMTSPVVPKGGWRFLKDQKAKTPS